MVAVHRIAMMMMSQPHTQSNSTVYIQSPPCKLPTVTPVLILLQIFAIWTCATMSPFLFLSLLCLSFIFISSSVFAVEVGFSPCDSSTDASTQSLTWSTKDGDASASIIDYRLCGRRSQDLRFVTHMRLVHWSSGQQLVDREFAICSGTDAKRQSCLDQLAVSNKACLTGSVVVRLPAFANSPDGRTRSEILVSEGQDSTIMRFCSN